MLPRVGENDSWRGTKVKRTPALPARRADKERTIRGLLDHGASGETVKNKPDGW
jgi:hypothetical protein